ncbi:UDP-4-amino-4,6-dideoxy-N-acetyl-beta-L-altrosamine transaminase [Maridesulfovibrio frigidus]|uniref:UDP-4-amino-4, 6-dideoxy-N-acetyl-beta-L-altrosamine transaminase n=1 Tax=Maridesulfovibrio frigidus TaxID=340956 RepID=UPI0004E0FDB0|nr:UDP-4-amino-4,6-dideoxy-N-acetyl-beta-L-altrosamine transaminase [Maridesulfovibrio frigidus]
MIPYGKHIIDEDDISEVVKVLRGDWLTTGPIVTDFENGVAKYIGVKEAVAVSSGTAALHAAMHALEIKPGDEVIVSPLTFAASANCVVYMGATPVFADVNADTLLIDPESVIQKITQKTRAIIAVDYAGQTCDYKALKSICEAHNLKLVGDCCHSIGAKDEDGNTAGSLADISVLSFHPVKHITTGEGGMALTDDPELAKRMRSFRSHGINIDASARLEKCTWVYEMQELGYNYRITDIQCALGLSQLKKLDNFLEIRRKYAAKYRFLFLNHYEITPLRIKKGVQHAFHLYVVKVPAHKRKAAFEEMRNQGFGVNVHYIPVHYHPYYMNNFKTGTGLCPVAEEAYEGLMTLPLHPGMTERQVDSCAKALDTILKACS